jgi:hypothetical protein
MASALLLLVLGWCAGRSMTQRHHGSPMRPGVGFALVPAEPVDDSDTARQPQPIKVIAHLPHSAHTLALASHDRTLGPQAPPRRMVHHRKLPAVSKDPDPPS